MKPIRTIRAIRPHRRVAGLVFVGLVATAQPLVGGPPAGAACTVTGTAGPDRLGGTAGADVVCGSGGDDVIYGLQGDDTLYGGPGNDVLYGDDGDDTVVGGDGDDLVREGKAASGADFVSGGAGRDRVSYSERTAAVRVSLDEVADDGEAGEADRVRPDVEDVRAGAGADAVTGSSSANALDGGPGPDALAGGAGPDALAGGPGDDALDGGAEADVCDAQAGSDTTTGCEKVLGGPAPGGGETAVLLAAGDIAHCDSPGDEATAKLLDAHPDAAVAAVGDNVYPDGSLSQYARCYDPTWGRAKGRTRPAVGNHEYRTPGAAGYFSYFGAAAGDPARGYYSYELGAWHVVVLNSECWQVGGCERGSPQETWLRQDLAAHPTRCTLAYWHTPRFLSAHGGGHDYLGVLWQDLYDAGADVVLGGHYHNYERLAPLDPQGQVDLARGVRSFVVGTGGATLHALRMVRPGSEVRDWSAFGVLKLDLRPDGYDWRFLPVAGKTFTDSGSSACH